VPAHTSLCEKNTFSNCKIALRQLLRGLFHSEAAWVRPYVAEEALAGPRARGTSQLTGTSVRLIFLSCKNCQTNSRQSESSSPVWRHKPLRTSLRSRPSHRSPLETLRAAWHCSLQPSPPAVLSNCTLYVHVNIAAATHVAQGQSCANLVGETAAR